MLYSSVFLIDLKLQFMNSINKTYVCNIWWGLNIVTNNINMKTKQISSDYLSFTWIKETMLVRILKAITFIRIFYNREGLFQAIIKLISTFVHTTSVPK